MTPTKTWAIPSGWCTTGDNFMWESMTFVPDGRYPRTNWTRIPPGYFVGVCQSNGDVYKFTADTDAAGTAATPVEITHYGDPPCGIGYTNGHDTYYDWETGLLWWSHTNGIAVSDVNMNCLGGPWTMHATTPDIEGVAVGRGYLVTTDDNAGTNNVQRYERPTPYLSIDGKLAGGLKFPVNDDDCTGEQGTMWWDTTDSAWEFCNANSGVPTVLGGSSGTVYQTKAVTIVNPTAAEVMTWFYAAAAITVDGVVCVRTGGTSIDVTIKYATNRTDSGTDIVADQTVSSTGAGDALTVADSSVETGGKWLWFTTSGISGAVTELSCTLRYHE